MTRHATTYAARCVAAHLTILAVAALRAARAARRDEEKRYD